MKSLIKSILLITAISLASCKAPEEKAAESTGTALAEISFSSNIHNFGDIPYESDGRCYFTFFNNSKTDLIVNNVRTSCGCTRPEWPKEPVAPGESGKIGITYNTKIPGGFNKSITVYTNTENSPIKLFIKGNVLPEPKTTSN